MRFVVFGGDKRDRTADLLNAIQALSQLSYTPIYEVLEIGLPILRTFYNILNVVFGKNGGNEYDSGEKLTLLIYADIARSAMEAVENFSRAGVV